MAALGADYPVIKEIPIGLKASGRRREFDRMGEVEVPPTATGARRLGQEWSGWAAQLRASVSEIERSREDLYELAIDGARSGGG